MYKINRGDSVERIELKKLLTKYVDLLNRYEKEGNKSKIKRVKQSIEHIKKQLKG